MDIVEIIVIISVIWSVISSITSKNKKKTGTNPSKQNPVEPTIEELFGDLSGFIQRKNESAISTSEPIVDQINHFDVIKPIETVQIKENSQNISQKVLSKENSSSKSEFTSAFKHTEHFDESKLLHHPIISTSDEDILVESPIYSEDLLNPRHIREAVLLNEILNKPKALQSK
jgi:hypothetical protein